MNIRKVKNKLQMRWYQWEWTKSQKDIGTLQAAQGVKTDTFLHETSWQFHQAFQELQLFQVNGIRKGFFNIIKYKVTKRLLDKTAKSRKYGHSEISSNASTWSQHVKLRSHSYSPWWPQNIKEKNLFDFRESWWKLRTRNSCAAICWFLKTKL